MKLFAIADPHLSFDEEGVMQKPMSVFGPIWDDHWQKLKKCWMETVTVSVDWLFPIGLRSASFFAGSDYFPIFPGFGWFLIGAALGKTVYRKKESLLPSVNADFFLLRGLRFVGRHSLWFYLLHQPVLFAIIYIFVV